MARFIRNEDETVTDSKTSLIWSKTLDTDVTHASAENMVSLLDGGWRLPTVEELFSLIDRSRYSPAIDTEFFPDIKSDCYWTSTPFAWNTEAAVWVVHFDGGYVGYYHRGNEACVVAVRSSQ